MTTKLTLRDLEAMRQHYGIAQGGQEEPPPSAAASRHTYDLLEDLEQVRVLEEVGISLQRWAQLRDVPMEYALALREYLDQEEEEQEANREGRRSSKPPS
jgi:hypothetical protein